MSILATKYEKIRMYENTNSPFVYSYKIGIS